MRFLSLCLGLLVAAFVATPGTAREIKSFDDGWLFLQAAAAGAEQPGFADDHWRRLDVPHDWSIAGPFSPTNGTGGAGGFLPAGTGWYRKHFTLPDADANQSVTVEFEGVMANSDVWINGFHLGHRPFGYVGLNYELTGQLHFGGDNVIAVRCDNSRQPASRFYAGAGIYRHVWLVITSPVHIQPWGVFVSTPQVAATLATVRVETTVANESRLPQAVTVQTTLLSPEGQAVASIETQATLPGTPGTAPANDHPTPKLAGTVPGAPVVQQIVLPDPQLWELAKPNLYRAVSLVRAGGKILDAETNVFGIRDAHFEAATGFWLNGKNFKLKGVCLHADGGAFGMAVPVAVWAQRLAELKKLGVNAIRTAHNPPAPEFLDLCDRMGFLVMDEFFDCWTVGKQGLDGVKLADYHLYFDQWSHLDERDTIRRDRNHPGVILYSVGNEIHDTPQADKAKHILAGLIEVAHTADPTRPVTMALFRPNASHDYDDGLADMLDVVGQNYREQEILAAHAQKPSRKILGTENTHTRQQWVAVRDHAPYAGEFIWTGVDYLGEARRWPLVGHGSGLLDRTGAPRPVAFERQSWWSDRPMVRLVRRVAPDDAMPTDPGYAADEKYSQVLFADWTPRNTRPHVENVEVYSNCKEVELFLNGTSLGTESLHPDASPRTWKAAYAPGTLKAVARDAAGKVVATDELRTASAPAKIILSADKNQVADDWDGVCEITATITDKDGNTDPTANDLVSFSLSGAGEVAAVDNANNQSHESFQAHERHAFHGRCVAFVKATASSGQIILTATAPDLKSDSITIMAVQ